MQKLKWHFTLCKDYGWVCSNLICWMQEKKIKRGTSFWTGFFFFYRQHYLVKKVNSAWAVCLFNVWRWRKCWGRMKPEKEKLENLRCQIICRVQQKNSRNEMKEKSWWRIMNTVMVNKFMEKQPQQFQIKMSLKKIVSLSLILDAPLLVNVINFLLSFWDTHN